MRVQIEKILPNLNGEITFEGKKYEIPYLVLKDEVEFLRVRRKKVIISQKWIRTPRSSVNCDYYSLCGGCNGQHIKYETQFHLKTKPIIDEFQSMFQILPQVQLPDKIYHYRNRMDFVTFPEKIGLRKRGNFRKIIDIQTCNIQSKWANDELKILRNIFFEYSHLIYDRKTENGFLKYITLRRSFETEDSLTILTFNEDFYQTEQETSLENKILKLSTANHILFCYTRKKGEISASGSYKIIKGKASYQEKIFGKKFEIPFDSFAQPNLAEFQNILDFVYSYIDPNSETMIDLFCGIGFFSLIFGEKFKNLYGFDVCKSAIEKAISLLKSHFPEKKIDFRILDLFTKKSKKNLQLDIFEPNTTLFFDPPRSGLHSYIIENIVHSQINDIFYISCNPKKQIEDLMKLQPFYKIKDVLIIDPYPQTPHLESVCFLQKK